MSNIEMLHALIESTKTERIAAEQKFEKDKNDEITARMVTEISQQIERCLGKMDEVVEIQLW